MIVAPLGEGDELRWMIDLSFLALNTYVRMFIVYLFVFNPFVTLQSVPSDATIWDATQSVTSKSLNRNNLKKNRLRYMNRHPLPYGLFQPASLTCAPPHAIFLFWKLIGWWYCTVESCLLIGCSTVVRCCWCFPIGSLAYHMIHFVLIFIFQIKFLLN